MINVEKLTAFRRRLKADPHWKELDRLLLASLSTQLEDLYLAQEEVLSAIHGARMKLWIYDHLLEKVPSDVKVLPLPGRFRPTDWAGREEKP